MFGKSKPRQLQRSILAVALGAFAIAACQAAASPTRVPAASPAAPAGPAAAGTITLTDTGCDWAGNPGTLRAGRVSLAVTNETDDYAVFGVHKLRPGKTWADGEAAIALIQKALRDGVDWPGEVFQVSDVVTEPGATAGASDTVEFFAPAGTLGVVCSANTSPTGDVLTIFLAGPLIVNP